MANEDSLKQMDEIIENTTSNLKLLSDLNKKLKSTSKTLDKILKHLSESNLEKAKKISDPNVKALHDISQILYKLNKVLLEKNVK